MPAWTTISNALVAVGAKPFATTMQALRDNPIAIAEGASGAPVLSTGWHPYNMVNVGDGNDGKFYDFAVDGARLTITTPTFEDGYDYFVRWEGASPVLNATDFRMAGIALTGAPVAAGASMTGFFEITAPTLLNFPKIVRLQNRSTAAGTGLIGQNNTAALPLNADFSFSAMAGALTSISFDFTAQNHDAGKYYLYRRRNFMFG